MHSVSKFSTVDYNLQLSGLQLYEQASPNAYPEANLLILHLV